MKTQKAILLAGLTGFGYCNAQDGAVDMYTVTFFSMSYDKAYALAIQPDNKIVLAGTSLESGEYDFAVVRLMPDGNVDATFGVDGISNTDFSGQHDEAAAIAIQPDGKIVVAGRTSDGSNDNFALARYHTNGFPDLGFGTGGKVITDFSGANDSISDLVLQSDGKILVVGATSGGSGDVALARYNSDGTPDSDFDSDGKVTTDFSGSNEYATGVAVLPGGKILVSACTNAGGDSDFALVRYLSNGSIDNTFDTDGKVISDLTGGDDYVNAICVQPDGRILLAGGAEVSASEFKYAVVRYQTNGILDNTFATGGVFLTAVSDHGGTMNERATAIALQTDGRIVAAGYSDYGYPESDYSVISITTNGILDNGFGTGGRAVFDFGMPDKAWGMVIQPDQKILMTGETGIRMGTVRYLPQSVGVEEIELTENTIRVFPNPAQQVIRIELDSRMHEAVIDLYALDGKKMMTFSNISGASADLDLSELAPGIYQLVVENNSVIYRSKFVKN